jgi:hypothetical protein
VQFTQEVIVIFLFFCALLSTFLSFGNYQEYILASQPTQIELTLTDVKDSHLVSLTDNFLSKINKAFKAPIFVESGTFMGQTAKRAAAYFKTVHTIELSQALYQANLPGLKPYGNIKPYWGDSGVNLISLLPKIKEKIVFWLDGHYSGGGTAKGITNTPILAELEAIKKSGITNSIILIDDLWLFYKPTASVSDSPLDGYPTLDILLSKVKEIHSDYRFVVLGTVLLCARSNELVTISPILSACTASVIYDALNTKHDLSIIEIEKIIMQANKLDATVLTAHNGNYESFLDKGMSQHLVLWKALILLGQKQFELAIRYFELLEKVIPHWRIQWYLAQALAQQKKLELAKSKLVIVMHEEPLFEPAKNLFESL